jgi:hypothetical protein
MHNRGKILPTILPEAFREANGPLIVHKNETEKKKTDK